MKRSLILILTLIFLIFFTPITYGRDIKIGIIDCYSGPPAAYCNDLLNGFKLALEKINREGIDGRKITFITRDTKFKVDIALNAAKELVMRENIDLLMGTINSAAALAVSEFCKAEKFPFMVGIAMSEKITGEKGHRYVFRVHGNTAQMGKAGAVGLSKLPFKRYWIAGDDYEYGHAIANSTWNHLRKLRPDVKLLGQSWWKVGEPDFTPYINSILASKPDALIIACGARDLIPFLKAAKATGMSKRLALYAYAATDLSTLKPLGKEAPVGVYGTAPYHFYFPKTKENTEFSETYFKRYGTFPGFGALDGYCMAKFIAKTYRIAKSLDKERFIDTLEGLEIDSPVGKIKMRAIDHQAMVPAFFGVTAPSDRYPFLIAKDVVIIPGDQIMPTEEEIKRLRR